MNTEGSMVAVYRAHQMQFHRLSSWESRGSEETCSAPGQKATVSLSNKISASKNVPHAKALATSQPPEFPFLVTSGPGPTCSTTQLGTTLPTQLAQAAPAATTRLSLSPPTNNSLHMAGKQRRGHWSLQAYHSRECSLD